MKRTLLLSLILLTPLASEAKRRQDLEDATSTATKADEQIRTNPALTPEQRAEQQEIKRGAVQQIETIGNSEQADPQTQIDVSKSLASVSEAPRAIPFAERGLALAERSNDPKLLREALLTGADVYYRAGDYETSRKRAERILKDNPNDKDARMLYMQVKDRAAASAPAIISNQGTSNPRVAAAPEPHGYGTPGAVAAAPPVPKVAMTNAGALEAKRQLELGRAKAALDPKAALAFLDAAVAADGKDADARVARSQARLAAGDPVGARADADAAVALSPTYADAYAARAEASRALNPKDPQIEADYAEAARLDAKFKDAYEAIVAKASAQGGARNVAGSSAPDPVRGMSGLPEPVRKYGLIGVFAGGLGCVVAALLLKKKSDEGTPQG